MLCRWVFPNFPKDSQCVIFRFRQSGSFIQTLKALWSFATFETIPWLQHYITEESAVTLLWKPQNFPLNWMCRIQFPRRPSFFLGTATSTVIVSSLQHQAYSQWVLDSSLVVLRQELEAHRSPASNSGLCIGHLLVLGWWRTCCIYEFTRAGYLFYFIHESAITITCS